MSKQTLPGRVVGFPLRRVLLAFLFPQFCEAGSLRIGTTAFLLGLLEKQT